MHRLKPQRNRVAEIFARKPDIARSRLRPAGNPGIQIMNQQVAAIKRHGQGIEHALVQADPYRREPGRSVVEALDLRLVTHLVAVHLPVGVHRRLLHHIARGRLDAGDAEAERIRHPGALALRGRKQLGAARL